MKVKKALVLVVIIGLMLVGCNKNNNSDEAVYIRKDISESELESAEISVNHGTYAINVNSYSELAGDSDYVIVGKVLENISVEYEEPVEVENEDGSTSPFGIKRNLFYVDKQNKRVYSVPEKNY